MPRTKLCQHLVLYSTPWPFAWTSRLSMVISPENFRMIRWQEHCQKGVTDRQTDIQTEISVLRAAWSQLKLHLKMMSGKWQPSCLGLNVLTHDHSLTRTLPTLEGIHWPHNYIVNSQWKTVNSFKILTTHATHWVRYGVCLRIWMLHWSYVFLEIDYTNH